MLLKLVAPFRRRELNRLHEESCASYETIVLQLFGIFGGILDLNCELGGLDGWAVISGGDVGCGVGMVVV